MAQGLRAIHVLPCSTPATRPLPASLVAPTEGPHLPPHPSPRLRVPKDSGLWPRPPAGHRASDSVLGGAHSIFLVDSPTAQGQTA